MNTEKFRAFTFSELGKLIDKAPSKRILKHFNDEYVIIGMYDSSYAFRASDQDIRYSYIVAELPVCGEWGMEVEKKTISQYDLMRDDYGWTLNGKPWGVKL